MVSADFSTQLPAATPEAALEELTAGRVEAVSAEQSARTAAIRVRDASGQSGSYEVEKAQGGCVVVAGRGCGAL